MQTFRPQQLIQRLLFHFLERSQSQHTAARRVELSVTIPNITSLPVQLERPIFLPFIFVGKGETDPVPSESAFDDRLDLIVPAGRYILFVTLQRILFEPEIGRDCVGVFLLESVKP